MRQAAKHTVRIALLGLICSASSGCIMYRLEELRSTAPSGTPFQNELSRMYLDFATKEEKQYDWQDSWHFADKGLILAYGRDAGPELIEDWNLPEESRSELEKTRIRVMDALTPELKTSQPSKAAAIQFYFDCWVEEQEENWQPDDIAHCRDHLMHALGSRTIYDTGHDALPAHAKPLKASGKKPARPALENPSGNIMPFKPGVPPKADETVKTAKAAPKDGKDIVAETSSYAVFFEPGKAEISAPGKNVLHEVVGTLKGKADYVVVLHVAGKGLEKDLLRSRMDVVKKALTVGGVTESAILDSGAAAGAKPVARRIELFLNE